MDQPAIWTVYKLKRKKFYAKAFLPLFILLTGACFFKFDLRSIMKLSVGYLWVMSSWTPGIDEVRTKKSYRFSFLRFINFFERILSFNYSDSERTTRTIFGRILAPYVFCKIIAFLFSYNGEIELVLLGSMVGELLISGIELKAQLFLVKRLQKPSKTFRN